MTYRHFFDAEAVRAVRDPLAKLLRVLFHRRGITTDDFVKLHGNYWNHWNRGGQHDNEATHRNNQRRTLLADKISWGKFHWMVSDMMRLNILDFTVTVQDEAGAIETYSIRDLDKILNPPDPAATPPGYHPPHHP